jgi:hypothetical protein
VRHVDKELRTACVGGTAAGGEVKRVRVRRNAGDDDLGLF